MVSATELGACRVNVITKDEIYLWCKLLESSVEILIDASIRCVSKILEGGCKTRIRGIDGNSQGSSSFYFQHG